MRRLYLVTTPAGACIPARGIHAARRLAAWFNAHGIPAALIRWKLAHRRA